jgi:hypothetical protein
VVSVKQTNSSGSLQLLLPTNGASPKMDPRTCESGYGIQHVEVAQKDQHRKNDNARIDSKPFYLEQ